jgi:hypothetical protein
MMMRLPRPGHQWGEVRGGACKKECCHDQVRRGWTDDGETIADNGDVWRHK